MPGPSGACIAESTVVPRHACSCSEGFASAAGLSTEVEKAHRHTYVLSHSNSQEIYRLQMQRMWRGIPTVERTVWGLWILEFVSTSSHLHQMGAATRLKAMLKLPSKIEDLV